MRERRITRSCRGRGTDFGTQVHDFAGAYALGEEGEPRLEKTYAESTPADQFRIDTPGCTGILTLQQVMDEVKIDD